MTKQVCFALLIALAALPAYAQDSEYAPRGSGQQFSVPSCYTEKGAWEVGSKACNAGDTDEWLADITHWRNERKIRIGYSEQRYHQPAFAWAQSAFMQPQMMVQDR